MYVVRRPFRNYGEIILPGSIVEPGNVKRFKSRLNERTIVEVTAQTLDSWNDYFVGKFGVAIKKPEPIPEVKPTVVQPEVKPAVAQPEVKVTPVVKVAPK